MTERSVDKKTEALKLALGYMDGTLMTEHLTGYERKRHVMQSIREALAQAPTEQEQPAQVAEPRKAQSAVKQQEPVAWRTFDGEGGYDYRTYDMNENYAKEWDKQNPKHKGWVEPLYTSPQPNKPWAGLSTDEIYGMYNEPRSDAEMVEFARAIEAKLREKNT